MKEHGEEEFLIAFMELLVFIGVAELVIWERLTEGFLSLRLDFVVYI